MIRFLSRLIPYFVLRISFPLFQEITAIYGLESIQFRYKNQEVTTMDFLKLTLSVKRTVPIRGIDINIHLRQLPKHNRRSRYQIRLNCFPIRTLLLF